MFEATRPGGLYNVGTLKEPRYVDANGRETEAPSKKEGAASGEKDESGPLAGVDFASDEAAQAASDAGLTAADFKGQEPSGAGGFTKPDVRKIVEAKG